MTIDRPNVLTGCIKSLFVVCALSAALPVMAAVQMPTVFTDNMMLQRDQPIRVWGWADVDEAVSVTLLGKTVNTKVDKKGTWSVELPAVGTGENLEMIITGTNSVTLKNIIIGDIWVCSGQSNMEMSLNGCLGAKEDMSAADFPKIRRIKFNHVQSGMPEDDAPAQGAWQECSPKTVGGFTAVGFYFARDVHQKTGVPIGIVDANWGGSRIEPWVPLEGLALVDDFADAYKSKQAAITAYRAGLPAYFEQMESWITKSRTNLANGDHVSAPPVMPKINDGGWSGMYNGMISSIIRLPIKGALWYQGESNGNEGDSYFQKKRALIGGWRKLWNQGDFPFYFVQLANFKQPNDNPAGGDGWAKHREAQSKCLTIPQTGMAVIIDTVPLNQANDIHPKNKFDVGTRLARWALVKDYGQKDLVYSGPLFKELKIEGNKARISFEHTGSGLMVGKKEGRSPAVEDSTGKLTQFSIAGADKKWYWADAVIENNTVVLSSAEVQEPVAVRYAFSMNPNGANLYNREGLPASPFRTDTW